ncbi:MAG: hypothetical protein JWQ96_2481 [Segetibacter sp.]|nr:hypothetical protein [Segetibacter sp.]
MIGRILILFIGCILVTRAGAQETIYVPKGATVFFGNKVPVGLFGFVRNDGNMAMQQNSQLFFLGKIWVNQVMSKISDESLFRNSVYGGTVHFVGSNSTYGVVGQQILESGYKDSLGYGNSFSNIVIDNNLGVIITTDLNVLNELHFRRGHLYLNNHQFVSGNGQTSGKITGFDETRFIVTGNTIAGGFVKHRSVATGATATFPIGATDRSYSPAQVLNNGTLDDFKARVFANVLTHAISGSILFDSTLQATWEIAKKNPGNDEAVITLQHDGSAEDPVFKANRYSSYISLYDSAVKWDKPNSRGIPQTPGSISSSFAIATAMMNSRKIYFNKLSLCFAKKVSLKKKSFETLNVFSPNGDGINDVWTLKGLKDFTTCTVEVFTRYGQKVFSSVGYNNPWNGTLNSQILPVGTYYYVIDLRDGTTPFGGSVTILR